ncbi:MAG: MFS transporter [Bacteroidota bacterium]
MVALTSEKITTQSSWRWPIASVAWLFFTMSILLGSWLARLPEIQAKLQLSEGTLGLALLGMPLGALLGTQLASRINAVVTTSKANFYSGLLLCFTVILPPLAWNFWVFAVALAIFGFADGWMNVSMNAAASTIEERSGKVIMSSCHGMFSLGAMIGAASAGFIANWGIPLYWHIPAIAMLMGGSLFIFKQSLFGLPDTPITPSKWSLPGRSLVILALIGCFVMIGEGAIADWGAIYLRKHLDSSLLIASWGFAAFSLMMAIGRFSGDRIRLMVSGTSLLKWGSILGALGLSMVVFAPSPGMALVGFMLTGLGFSVVVPIVFSMAAKVDPNNGIATIASVGIVGFLFAPTLIGVIGELFSLQIAFGLLAVLALSAAVLSGRS